jgi:ABC-type polysaccharide/polyol phosphate export permease
MLTHLTAIWKFRHFLLALVRLDLRMRYKRSVLGIGWSLLHPIAMTIVFTVVFSNLLGANARTYAPFLLAGMAVWGFLRESAVTGCRALLANEAYIRQSPLPYGIYTLRVVLGQAIHFLIAMVVVLVLIVFLQQSTAALTVLWAVLPGLVLAFLAAWAVATITAFANVYFHDTQHLLEVGTQILFFLTPIIYLPGVLENKGLGWMLTLNPVNLFLDLIREPLLTGRPPAPELYLSGLGLTAVLIGLAAGTMAWLQKRVIFHL